jgi:hypothetical protein
MARHADVHPTLRRAGSFLLERRALKVRVEEITPKAKKL